MRGFVRKFKPLEILTEEQVEAIHKGTLEILREVGIRLEHERALKLFKENGCEVDLNKKRVKFPEALVEECLRKCPSSFQLKARDPKNNVMIGGDTVHFMNGPGTSTVDLDTWEPRPATKKEYYDYVKVLDALPTLHFFNSYPYFGFEGPPEVMKIPEGFAAKMRNSTKATIEANSFDADVFCIEMAKAIGIEYMDCCLAAPPLTYYRDQIESAYRLTEAGFPTLLNSGCVHGGTGPATIAGSIITNNAELIAGIVLIQLIKPGTRILTMDQTYPQNMRTGTPFFDAIGCSLHTVASAQVWRKYRIPFSNTNPGYTNSKSIDFQNGYERMINAVTSALAGIHVIAMHGGICGELSAHPVQAVLDDDIAGMIGRFMEGVEVNDETLAIDLIKEVGPIPGHYLNKAHTRKWWKLEQFLPKAADTVTYPEWMEKGKKGALDYAKERVGEILATHEPTPLTEDQEDAIRNVLKKARNYYKERGLTE